MSITVEDLDGEIWLPVVGFEDSYQVSSFLRIKSLERNVIRSNGWPMAVRERILTPILATGCPTVVLNRQNRKPVHRTIASLYREAMLANSVAGQDT